MTLRMGLGCFEHPEWDSIMVPLWWGWWLPRLHLWVHEHTRPHTDAS